MSVWKELRRTRNLRLVLLVVALASCAGLSGCQPQLDDDADIKELAANWPDYGRPASSASAAADLPRSATSDSTHGVFDEPAAVEPAADDVAIRSRRPELDTPALVIRSYRVWSLKETAADSLTRIGEPAVPQLTRTLFDDDPQMRYQAAHVLGRIGPPAEASVSALIETLNDPNPEVRKAAARALGQIGPQAGEAVPRLMDLIRDAPAEQAPSLP